MNYDEMDKRDRVFMDLTRRWNGIPFEKKIGQAAYMFGLAQRGYLDENPGNEKAAGSYLDIMIKVILMTEDDPQWKEKGK